MSETFADSRGEVAIAYAAALVEDQLRDGGYLVEIAAAKVEALPENLTPADVAEIILPEPKGEESLQPRWTYIESAEAATATKAMITENGDRIITTAEAVDLRKIVYGERQPEDLTAIVDPETAIFVAEGGANKTSIVRRGVAVRAMHDLLDDNEGVADLSPVTLYQFGSGRVIAPTREVRQPDGSMKTVPNAEYSTIRELAGDFLPTDSFTEFEANMATALAEGYEIAPSNTDHDNDNTVSRWYELRHEDPSYPKLTLIQPAGKRLEEGYDTIKELIENSQLVIATNGQYREKDKHQAELWAKAHNVTMLPAVAIGDEPGDRFPFADGEVVVPNRPEAAYVNELIMLWRLAVKRLPDVA